eukprot:sb/3469786/
MTLLAIIWIDKATRYETYCKMESTPDGEPVGWTLLGSFVNGDGVSSWSGDNTTNWLAGASTFGTAEWAEHRDFKSPAWDNLRGRYLMVEDRFGYIEFYLGPYRKSLTDLISSPTRCSTTPLRGPGRNVRSSSTKWARHGALLVLPQRSDGCAILSENKDLKDMVPVLGFGGTTCGLLGAGMVKPMPSFPLGNHSKKEPIHNLNDLLLKPNILSGLAHVAE